MKNLNRHQHGFNLIEILVVITLIAILISILSAVFTKSRENAQTLVCNNNLSQLVKSQLAYVVDNDGNFARSSEWVWSHPTKDGIAFPGNSDPTNIQSVYSGTIYPYYENAESHLCPVATDRLPLQNHWSNDTIARNYVMNWNLGPVGHPWDWRGGRPKYLPNSDQEMIDTISYPSDMLVVGEENSFPLEGFNLWSQGLNDGFFHADPYDAIGSFHEIKNGDLTTGITYAAMVDGHVRSVTYNGYTVARYGGKRKEYSEMYCSDDILNED